MIKNIYSIEDCTNLEKYNKFIIKLNNNNLLDIIEKLKNYKNLIVIEIDISNDNYEILKYIKDNYKLNILINYTTSLNQVKLSETDICSLDEYLNLELILNRYIKEINKKNYSNLEKCIYAYDLIKLHVYKYTSGYYTEDRQIHNTINDIKHVCASFSMILNAILTKLKISSISYKTYFVRNDLISIHYKNICHLKDDKYNIDGIYYLDSIADKMDGFDDYYSINKYGHFLVRPEKLFHYLLQEVVTPATCVYVDKSLDKYINEDMKNESINLFEQLLDTKINNYDELIHITNKYNNKIYPKPLLDAIMNVRTKEKFINNQLEYDNTLNDIINSFIKCENKKMNQHVRYIFLNNNNDRIYKNIYRKCELFDFEFNQIYGRIDTPRK